MSTITGAYMRVLQPLFRFGEARSAETAHALRAARLPMFPEVYLSVCYLSSMVGAVLVTAVTGGILLGADEQPALLRLALALGAGLAVFFVLRLGFLVYPRIVASGRGRAIDAEFPSVAMLCYALARGGMGTPQIFRVVAEERETYGEISREFALIMREIENMGLDMNSALVSVASSTPSARLKTFFEGLVTILNSGADPRDYYKRQAETQLAEAELNMGKEVEQAGLLAESYVSGLLVLPLLLVVVLSVLSVLGTVKTFFIPIIIFMLVPGGTFAYLILVDMLLPPQPLGVPRTPSSSRGDAGMDTMAETLPSLPRPAKLTRLEVERELQRDVEAGGERGLRAQKLQRFPRYAYWVRRFAIAWRALIDRSLNEPLYVLRLSAPAAGVVLAAGATYLYVRDARETVLLVYGTGLLLATALVALVPVSLFHELRVRKARLMESALPETLSKLAGFNERGVPLLRSFQILGQSTKGPLAEEFRTLDRDVSWTANLTGALARMRARAATRKLRKVGILFERGVAATGNLKEVLEIAAAEAATSESQSMRRRQAMMSYTVVVYVVFSVFLYVIFTVTDLFYGPAGFASMQTGGSVSVANIGRGIPVGTAQALYLSAVLIQGACCGFVAGKLGEGRVLSGLKHAAILCVFGWLVFYLGVFT